MKKDEFLDLINEIDDKFLNELAESEPGEKRVKLPPEEYGAPQKPQIVRLERPPKNRALFIAVFAAAVCAAAVMVGVVFIAKKVGDIPIIENSGGVVLPNDSTGVSIGETNTSSGDTQISPQKCKIYKQNAKIFTEEQLLALFDETPQRADKSSEDQICIEYTSEKHTGYLINNRTLKFYSKTGSYYSIICDYLCGNTDDERFISKDDELDFASREKVLEDLRSLLSGQFGISPDEWLIEDCFAVTRSGIDFYRTADVAANPEHSTNAAHDIPIEDFYSINIKFQIDGIPIYTGESLDYGATKIYGSTASVIISESGIQSICLSNPNETDTSEGSMEFALIPPEAAKELIQEKFSGFLPEEKGDVYDMRLIYLPIPLIDSDKNCEIFIAKPHYALYWKRTRNNNGTTSVSNFISYYDAVTGSDFLTKQISS